ncbi:MAG: site-2 protease family protein [Nitrososphaerales archaeon]
MEEHRRFEFHYGIVMLRTRRFLSVMDRLGRARISRPAGWFLLFFMPVACGIALFLFLSEAGVLLSPRGAAVGSYVRSIGPLANLGLPGINPYLPIVDGWIALFVAMVIHEGAHGVIARSRGIPVKFSGLIFFLVVPIGAFVDVDEDAVKIAKAADSARFLAAGAGINFVVGVVCLLLLFGVVSAMKPTSNQGLGVIVVEGSPLSNAGIKTYDYITAVNGIPIDSTSAISTSSWYSIGDVINVTVWRDGATFNRNITIGSQLFQNTTSGQNFTLPFLGLSSQSPSLGDLRGRVSTYTGSLLRTPFLYLCIPTLPNCQQLAPFSDTMSGFYTSSYGPSLTPLANLLYWLFFLNFSLAIFNSLPIYPLDGGLAFRVGVQALGRGKLSEANVSRITLGATLAVVALLLGVIVGPYLI